MAGSRDTSRSLFLDCLDSAAVKGAYKTIHKLKTFSSISREHYLSLVMVYTLVVLNFCVMFHLEKHISPSLRQTLLWMKNESETYRSCGSPAVTPSAFPENSTREKNKYVVVGPV